MSVKLQKSEIDALFLAIEETAEGTIEEVIVCCEAKGFADDLNEDQIIREVRAVFRIPAVKQASAIPIGVKTVGASLIHVIEFEAISREQAENTDGLTLASDALYEFVPPVPGVGERPKASQPQRRLTRSESARRQAGRKGSVSRGPVNPS